MGDMAELYNEAYDSQEEILRPCRLVHETNAAYLIEYKGRQAWFPKSCAVFDSDLRVLCYEDWIEPNWRVKNDN
jgi:hypothetical protein